jgi:hypothetical protein
MMNTIDSDSAFTIPIWLSNGLQQQLRFLGHQIPHQYNGISSIKGKCPSITSISSLDMSQSFHQKYDNELDTPPSHPPSTLLTPIHGTSINTTEDLIKDITWAGKDGHRDGWYY